MYNLCVGYQAELSSENSDLLQVAFRFCLFVTLVLISRDLASVVNSKTQAQCTRMTRAGEICRDTTSYLQCCLARNLGKDWAQNRLH